ncbi:hypothetical protein AA80_05270 [Petrotoga sibirica DSM 13575]|uniref:DUF401 family protein n=4 Tax=Petrotoga TaxID=28236 RepID=A0A4R8ERQ8_9BACT|nr:DUF401 family protein [Petrotoga olearia]PNR96443.1 hypothetical protein X929_04975 [Petrotoga olearia DSM 13574]POZ88545.1 hypothetical protein AA80_05270 [Petrotoga sibirica DSM 13575]RMA76487.1 hypothetical protein C8D75_0137 [Petrotoga olearia]TDX14899.1 hypothetical protein C8D74_10927 [Petrotoga sibirica]
MAVVSIISGLISMVISIKLIKKVHWAILIATIVTALVSLNLNYIGSSFLQTLSQSDFYEVIIVIFGIYLLSDTMKASGNSQKFAKNIEALFNSRQAVGLMPMLLGLLPMPGGAMFTAPMVKDIANESNINMVEATAMNYWFRHSMEFFWILYPALILESALTGIGLTKLLLIQLPIGLFAIIGGWLYFRIGKISLKRDKELWKELFESILPIIIIIVGVIASLPGWIVVLTVSLIYTFYHKNYKDLLNIRWETVLLLLFVFWYKNLVTVSNLSNDFVENLTMWGVSPWWIIMISPIIIGLITGITQAGFAVTMPIALSFVEAGFISLVPVAITTYFFSVLGVLLSPVHLCLLLTSRYFEVDMFSVIKKIAVPVFCAIMGYIVVMIFFIF